MKKKVLIPIIILGLLLLGAIGYLYMQLDNQKQENAAMQELAELDKKEMENEYEQFARQYSEMKTQINNDSIVAQLTKEQLRTQELLKELQQVKATDADLSTVMENSNQAEYTWNKDAASIQAVKGAQSADGAVYTLQGIGIAHPQKGVYIQNGKKTIFK